MNQINQITNNKAKAGLEDLWAIRPCHLYRDEYGDCTSIKARFHQYFIFGRELDCSQWLADFKNCERYQQSIGNDVEAGDSVIKSEEQRRHARLKAHYENDTWKKRKHPPLDWAKPLPAWLEKRNKNTFLEIKQKELSSLAVPQEEKERGFCVLQ